MSSQHAGRLPNTGLAGYVLLGRIWLGGALGALIVLALLLNAVELLCTSGLPAAVVEPVPITVGEGDLTRVLPGAGERPGTSPQPQPPAPRRFPIASAYRHDRDIQFDLRSAPA